MYNAIPVGLGELKFSNDPNDVLVAYGLGSCIGISVHDPKSKVTGLLHAVLPENNNKDPLSPKFVDSGIQALVKELTNHAVDLNRVTFKMVGGANMLVANGLTFNIGERNIAAAKELLRKQKIRIASEEVGGNIGRTMRVYIFDGRVTVRSLGNPEKEI
jgi:chemotaxis protein CheD